MTPNNDLAFMSNTGDLRQMTNITMSADALINALMDRHFGNGTPELENYLRSRTPAELEKDLMPIVSTIGADNFVQRMSALDGLLASGAKDYTDLLLQLASDESIFVRAYALEQSVKHARRVVCNEMLIKALQNDAEPTVRYTAAELLGEVGSNEAISVLQLTACNDHAVTDQGYPVSWAAMDALKSIQSRH